MARQQTSVVKAFIIHRQYHNTNKKSFQLRHFIEKLIFDLVPQVDQFISQGIPPIFKRRQAQWEYDRTRLNRSDIHAPFIEELPDDTTNDKHYRNECVLCGEKAMLVALPEERTNPSKENMTMLSMKRLAG